MLQLFTGYSILKPGRTQFLCPG